MKLLLNSVQTPHGTGLTPVQPNPTFATKIHHQSATHARTNCQEV